MPIDPIQHLPHLPHEFGAASGTVAARILSITIDQVDNTVGIVQFSTTVTAATPGQGDLENLDTADGASIQSQPDATHVRYATFSLGLTVGNHWSMASSAGLTFLGGVVLGPPTSGVIT